jgi:DNA-binding CsgD family transcriptional regulator
MTEVVRLKRRNGRLVIEIDAVIRVPIELEPIVRRASGDIKMTRREKQVLDGVLRSMQNKEVGASLHLSERTVKFHVSSLLRKFKVKSRTELQALFIR